MFRRVFNWYGKRIANSYATSVKQALSNDEWDELVDVTRRGFQVDPTFRIITRSRDPSTLTRTAALLQGDPDNAWGGHELEALLSPERVLANPLLTPYRRPAFRFLPASQRESLSLTPILVVPRFSFNAFANKFKVSDKRFVQLPFGFVFGLRCIAEIGLGLYRGDQFRDPQLDYFGALLVLARDLGGPTLNLYFDVYEKLGRKVHDRVSLSVVQCVHVMGVFLLLHELGHVSLDHWIPSSIRHLTIEETMRLRSQELAADEFAVRCILRETQDSHVPWDDVREMHCLFVLILLLTLETHCRVQKLNVPNHYPSFSERTQSLIRTLKAPSRLEKSIGELADRFALAKST
jgi:hypothetical protein